MALGNLVVTLSLSANQYLAGIKQAQSAAQTFSSKFKPLQQTLLDFGGAIRNVGLGLTAGVTLPIVAAGKKILETGMDFESAFAGVAKTVNATKPQLEALRQQFRDMAKEIPTSATELAHLGEIAGQLNIATADIADFTKQMAMLGATTNLSAEEAASAVGKFQNIFGAAGKNVDKFAATLVGLGNQAASTETEIVEMGVRIASAGHLVGVTQAEVLGFASTLASLGIHAEAGGSALSRVFLRINDVVATGGKRLSEFAEVADMSGDRFAAMFKSDPTEAVIKFVEGLQRLKGEGENVNAVFNDLFGTDIRLKNAMLALAGAGGELRRQIGIANEEWTKGTAAQIEFEKRLKTTESQLKILKQQLQDVGIELFDALRPIIHETVIPGLRKIVGVLAEIAEGFAKLPQPVQKATVGILGFAALVGPALAGIGFTIQGIAYSIGPITKLIGLLGRLAGAGAAAGGAGGLGGMTGTLATITGLIARLGPLGIKLVAVIAAIGLELGKLYIWKKIADFLGLTDAVKRTWEELKKLGANLKFLTIDFAKLVGSSFLEWIKSVRDHLLAWAVDTAPELVDGFYRAADAIVRAFESAFKHLKAAMAAFKIAWELWLNSITGYSTLKRINDLIGPYVSAQTEVPPLLNKPQQLPPGVLGPPRPPHLPTTGYPLPPEMLAALEAAAKRKPRPTIDPEEKKRLDELFKSFKEALRPADLLEEKFKDLRKVLKTITDEQLLAVFGDEIAAAVEQQKKGGFAVGQYIQSLATFHVAMKEATEDAEENEKAMEALKNEFQSALRPADEWTKRLINLRAIGATNTDIINLYWEEILEAVRAQEKHGFAIEDSVLALASQARVMEDIKKLQEEIKEGWEKIGEAFEKERDRIRDISGIGFPLDKEIPVIHSPETRAKIDEMLRRQRPAARLRKEREDLQATIDDINDLRLAGASASEIEEELGISLEKVGKRAKKLGMEIGPLLEQLGRVARVSREWRDDIEGMFNQFSNALVDILVDWDFTWKEMGRIAKDIMKSTAKSMLNSLISGFMEPFKQKLADLGQTAAEILLGGKGKGGGGGVLGGILGGGGGQAAGGILGGIFGRGGIGATPPTFPGGGGIGGIFGGATGMMGAINPVSLALMGANAGFDLVSKITGKIGKGRDAANEIVKSQNTFVKETLPRILDDKDLSATNKLKLLTNEWESFQQNLARFSAGGGENPTVANQAFATLAPFIAGIKADLIKSGATAATGGAGGTGDTVYHIHNLHLNIETTDEIRSPADIIKVVKANKQGVASEIAKAVFDLEGAIVTR